ncbi:cilia- and flagella-associated protein 418 [Betta splendens]|uniref:Cilia- and flagella-associated protein 418 n=1 Tax=Betta splendens TaxID=158456 RepID=A0A6P7KXI3_BETSP|nr:cilia- and flagella-associated protein 418 [Betta splendens]
METDDDLDELLDDIEKRFCHDVCVVSSSSGDSNKAGKSVKDKDGHSKSRTTTTNADLTLSSVTKDIDALLEELLEDDFAHSMELKTKQVERKPLSQSGGRKCCPVFVGGSFVTNGVGTSASKRSCDRLRCTSCDFQVLSFDDCEWDPSSDYLFFRNNVPDRQKLRAKLNKRRGSRAYACQCAWFSSSEPTDLRAQHQLRWVCGKHQD